MFEFENYEQYDQNILPLWNEGWVNELEFDGWILIDTCDETGINYRKLTEEEFNNKTK